MDKAIERLNQTSSEREKMVCDLLYTYPRLTDSQYGKKERQLNALPYKSLVNLCKKRIK